VQAEINDDAASLGRPGIDLINAEEEARIRELIAAGTWPNGWDGTEPRADSWMDAVHRDGSVQPILFRDLVGE
jgi:DNA sulfur modification protein DndC